MTDNFHLETITVIFCRTECINMQNFHIKDSNYEVSCGEKPICCARIAKWRVLRNKEYTEKGVGVLNLFFFFPLFSLENPFEKNLVATRISLLFLFSHFLIHGAVSLL